MRSSPSSPTSSPELFPLENGRGVKGWGCLLLPHSQLAFNTLFKLFLFVQILGSKLFLVTRQILNSFNESRLETILNHFSSVIHLLTVLFYKVIYNLFICRVLLGWIRGQCYDFFYRYIRFTSFLEWPFPLRRINYRGFSVNLVFREKRFRQ